MTNQEKLATIILFIILAILIFLWAVKPSGSSISEPPPCEPDYMGWCF